MQIKDLLAPSDVIVGLAATDKTALLHDLVGRAAAAIKLPFDDISMEILKREALGSTGVGDGIALPHARVAGVKAPFGLLARLAKPIDFAAVDGRPVDLVFLLLLPATAKNEQLNALACVARTLRDPGVLQELRGAKDSQALYQAMIEDTKRVQAMRAHALLRTKSPSSASRHQARDQSTSAPGPSRQIINFRF